MSLNTIYGIANAQNDALALSKSLQTALTSSSNLERNRAWAEVVVTSGRLVTGLNELAGNDARWLGWLGVGSNLAGLQIAANKISADLSGGGSVTDLKAGDVLAYVGGLSDFAGTFLIKPGPQLVAGLALKGVGLR